MVETKQETSAAVVVIVMILVGTIIYLLLAPPSLVIPYLSNTSVVSTNVSQKVPVNSYAINSYIGGTNASSSMFFAMPSFGISYSQVNSSVSYPPFSLSASIFGSGSYSFRFNDNESGSYTLVVNLSGVNGDPFIAVYNNGQVLYKEVAVNGQISIPVGNLKQGYNTVSIYCDLNGFAIYQSFKISGLKLVNSRYVNTSFAKSLVIPTLLGQGNFYLEFTPIGYGEMSASIDNQTVVSITNASNKPQNITIPQSIVEKALSSVVSSQGQRIFNLPLEVSFSIVSPGRYLVVNSGVDYVVPPIPEKKVSLSYSIPSNSSEYLVSLYVQTIAEQGNVTFVVSPSGTSFSIPASSLMTGANILVEPASYFSGQKVNGNYTGEITISSSGLIIPSYLSIQPS